LCIRSNNDNQTGMSEAKFKHLDYLQTTITRMAQNSFVIKGWSITLISALIALSANDSNKNYVLVAYFPCLIFWILDGYFLSQERLFRDLYDLVRAKKETEVDLNMNTSVVANKKNSWSCSTLSQTLLLFHGSIFVSILIIMFLIK
jgi:hypothetical protein